MTLYRIDESILGEFLLHDGIPGPMVAIHDLLDNGVLVPVEPCEHGNTSGHIVARGKLPVQKPNGDFVWCAGVGEETP